MGDYAEDGYNEMIKAEIAHEEYLYNVKHKIWKDIKGRELKIKDMKTEHLINCLKKICIERFRPEYKKIIQNELIKRGVIWEI